MTYFDVAHLTNYQLMSLFSCVIFTNHHHSDKTNTFLGVSRFSSHKHTKWIIHFYFYNM